MKVYVLFRVKKPLHSSEYRHDEFVSVHSTLESAKAKATIDYSKYGLELHWIEHSQGIIVDGFDTRLRVGIYTVLVTEVRE